MVLRRFGFGVNVAAGLAGIGSAWLPGKAMDLPAAFFVGPPGGARCGFAPLLALCFPCLAAGLAFFVEFAGDDGITAPVAEPPDRDGPFQRAFADAQGIAALEPA